MVESYIARSKTVPVFVPNAVNISSHLYPIIREEKKCFVMVGHKKMPIKNKLPATAKSVACLVIGANSVIANFMS